MTRRTECQPPGPVRPTARRPSVIARWKWPGVRLTGGLLRDWQRRNQKQACRWRCARWKRRETWATCGWPWPGASEDYRGPVFMDSDLYKTLEAIGWELGRDPSPELAEFAADDAALLERRSNPTAT